MSSTDQRRPVAIYRSEWLPISETFILSQLRSLTRHQPHLFGLRTVRGISLDDFSCTTLNSRVSQLAFRYLSHGPSFKRAVNRISPVLLHTHFAIDGTESLALTGNSRIPQIVTLHGYDVTTDDQVFQRSWTGRTYLSRRTKLYKSTAVFLCISEFIRKKAIERGFPAHKLQVHYIGVDTDRLKPGEIDRHGGVLFVGRLVEKKGLSFLLRAMDLVRRSFGAVELTVIGDGPLRGEYEAQARSLQIPCRFLGPKSHDQVLAEMSQAKIFCVPSVRAKSGDSEGLGIVFLEAQACGLPVVSFDHGGISEVVCNGETGLLAQEGNHQALADRIALLLQNDDLRRRLAHAARRNVVENFNLRKQTAKLELLYDNICQHQQAPSSSNLVNQH